MLVKIEARILIFPGTDFYFPSTSVPPGTFLGSASAYHAKLSSANKESYCVCMSGGNAGVRLRSSSSNSNSRQAVEAALPRAQKQERKTAVGRTA